VLAKNQDRKCLNDAITRAASLATAVVSVGFGLAPQPSTPTQIKDNTNPSAAVTPAHAKKIPASPNVSTAMTRNAERRQST